jgi:cyclin A
MEIDSICDVDNDFEDPQLCPTLASDIYMHLREAEVKFFPLPLYQYGFHQALNIRNCIFGGRLLRTSRYR